MENKIRNRFALDSMDLEFANEILEDNGYQDLKLTNKRKMILATLLYIDGIDTKDSKGYFYVENSYLCQIIGMSEPALIESLKYFNSIGIITRISGKRGSASLYKFNEKNFSNKFENLSNNFSDNFSNKSVDNQVVRELRTENLSNNFSKNLSDNFSIKLKNFSTDIDIEEDIDKEIEIKKDIELNKDKNNINNILINYILNLNNNINKINNNILYIKEKNNKKEKEIEELNFKVEKLIQKVDNNIKNNNKENFEINMKKEINKNITPSQDVLEMILAKLTSIETRITSIEEDIKSLKGQNCSVTSSNDSSNIITPIQEDKPLDAKEMPSEANYVNPMEIAKAVFSKKDEKNEEIEKRTIPTEFVKCEVKNNVKIEKKDKEIPTKAFASPVTSSNDVSGTIVPQEENKQPERKRMTDEEWKAICEKNARKESTSTRDVYGSKVASGSTSEGWINGVKQFSSMKEIDQEIAVWKRKGLDIMQIATRFKVNKETFTMTDKLFNPNKVNSQEVEVKKEENNTPSDSNGKVDKVAEILAKVNKHTEKEVVEEVYKNTKRDGYYAETNTPNFEYENDNMTSTEEALDNIFSSDYDEYIEEVPMNNLKKELEKRKQDAVVEVSF